MSHSFKRTPVYKDRSNRSKIKKFWKRQANKRIRKMGCEFGKKSNSYKKVGVEQWDICDYRFWQSKSINMTEDEKGDWQKYYYRK
uniref:hypothetical protein n=1 Tax=Acetatifactor sp. TaxID=1872090 RepID=UPI004057A109